MSRVFAYVLFVFALSTWASSCGEESQFVDEDAALVYETAPPQVMPHRDVSVPTNVVSCEFNRIDYCRTICYVVKVLSEMQFMGALDYASHPCSFYESELKDE